MSGSGRGPIAIAGIGCRFPGGADSADALWQLIAEGRDAIGPLPPGRFEAERFRAGGLVTTEGGFLSDIDRFDASFFGLSPREARKIDPQHRLLLELAWEALEDAGIRPSTLAGRRVGVYMGVWTGEYENVMYRTPTELDFHSITGGGRYAASGRISYHFDLRGPTLTVDTGCSASLVALHLARQALLNGEADVCLAGAANLVLQPHVNIGYGRSGMLSPGARCRFGDAGAGGYVRSDGAAVVVLKPLAAAESDGDRVRGVLVGTAVNADGAGSGQLATPSADAQAELLEVAYAGSGVDPASVPYVEAHGTGTRAGDPVELSALGRVLGRGRPAGTPLHVGSVKTNIGHTEAAAGMAGLVKAVMAVQHGRIPGSLHLVEPHEGIAWDSLNVAVPQAAQPWPEGAPRVAGVSSFGITGTNAHAIVAAAAAEEPGAPVDAGAGPYVVALSGASAAARDEAARRLSRHVADEAGTALGDVAYTTTCRRDHLLHRLAAVADTPEALTAALDAYAGGTDTGGVAVGTATVRSVALVFSGQGSQWLGMGRELLGWAEVFTQTLRDCDAIVHELAGWSVLAVLEADAESALEPVAVVQPTLACVQIALTAQLRAWGIAPAAAVGHSMGEVAAAYAAGALTLGDALRVIVVRSRLLGEIAGAGAMALVDLDEATAAEVVAGTAGRVSVASINGPRSTILSGDPGDVDAVLSRLDGEGIFCRRVKVDVASHSAQTDVLLPRLAAELASIAPRRPEIPFYSTARPDAPTDLLLDAGYWVDNLRRPVQLMAAVRRMMADSVDTFVEVAPHPVLLTSLADIGSDAGAEARTLASLRRAEPERRRLLELVARLHVDGVPVDWRAVSPGGRTVRLPAYPWQKERFWLEQWEDWSGDGSGATTAAPRPERAEDCAYVVSWRPEPPAPADAAGQWLVIGSGATADELARRIRQDGAEPVVLAGADAGAAVGAAARQAGGTLAGVVFLDAMDARCDGDATAFEAALERAYGGATSLLQALGAAAAEPSVGTLLVTAGVHTAAGRVAELSAVPQATLWGLARNVGPEQPSLRLRVLDVDPSADAATRAAAIWTAARHRGSSQLAAGPAGLFAARLARAPEAVAKPARWRHDCSYLITGGLGGLGLAAAAELVRGGARRLVLAGRSEAPPREEWRRLPPGHRFAPAATAIRALEREGASVHIAVLDVSSQESVATFLGRYRAEGWPPIRGVVHCAGTIEAADASWDTFRSIAGGKAVGAWNLHRALPQVDEFVLFSSFSSILPLYNANYAAANAVLDALGVARAGAGLPAVSLSWGGWSELGLTRREEVARTIRLIGEHGMQAFPPEEASALFRWAAASAQPHVMLAAVDWPAATAHLGGRPGADLYEELLDDGASGAPGAGAAGGARAAVLALPEAQRLRATAEIVDDTATRVLQLRPGAIVRSFPLGKQGLDSLMALELRNRLERDFGLRLPASLAWNYPTVELLARHLLSLLVEHADLAQDVEAVVEPVEPVLAAADVAQPVPAGRLEAASVLAELEGQTDDDVLRQLRGDA